MIFLLGGPPRVGKSIISSEIRQKRALSVVSTDTVGAVLESVLKPKETPDLFVFTQFNKLPEVERIKFIIEDPSKLINYVRKESRVVWKAVESFIRRENDEGRSVLIEGVAVLPELVSELTGLPYRVVFIGNQGCHLKENINKHAKGNENDWMKDVGDGYIEAFAIFVGQMSCYVEREAEKYAFKYIEMDNKPFQAIADSVLAVLELAK